MSTIDGDVKNAHDKLRRQSAYMAMISLCGESAIKQRSFMHGVLLALECSPDQQAALKEMVKNKRERVERWTRG